MIFGGGNRGYSGENVPHIRQLCWVSLLCLSSSAVAANVRLKVEGLSGELEKRSRTALYDSER